MKTGYRDFCEKHNEKIANDADIKENESTKFTDFRKRIGFSVNIKESSPGTMWIFGYSGDDLFVLDAEDLEYLYNKYSRKVQEEMDKNIEDIKNSYGNALKPKNT